MALSARLVGRARAAISRAESYIRSRQSKNGGFCFYKCAYVDEPNLHDTYHAVLALTLLGTGVPRSGELLQFLDRFPVSGHAQLYYYAFTLDSLGRASLIGPHRLAMIRNMAVTLPRGAALPTASGWLESILWKIRLQRRFAETLHYSEVVAFIERLRTEGGYGDPPNLLDTRLCMRILATLGRDPVREDLRAFVDALQVPSVAFALARGALAGNIETILAGVNCCSMLGVEVRYAPDALAFTLACQTSGGGFARAPLALPNIELTRRALQIIKSIDPNLVCP